jgi:serine/threonine protein kinase
VLIQIGEALQAAHEAGVVHRDLKPGNVILTVSPEGDPDQVKVLDFGTAKIFGPEETTELSTQGFTFGTPQYMSPEQLSGDPLDHRTDLYSFGILAYELLTGAPPFSGGFVEVAKAHLGQEPTAPSEAAGRGDVPAELDDVVLQCLAKASRERFMHAGLLLEALRVIR